jgi:hypothetical protein
MALMLMLQFLALSKKKEKRKKGKKKLTLELNHCDIYCSADPLSWSIIYIIMMLPLSHADEWKRVDPLKLKEYPELVQPNFGVFLLAMSS